MLVDQSQVAESHLVAQPSGTVPEHEQDPDIPGLAADLAAP